MQNLLTIHFGLKLTDWTVLQTKKVDDDGIERIIIFKTIKINQLIWPWHCLYFLPLPQGHGSKRAAPTRDQRDHKQTLDWLLALRLSTRPRRLFSSTASRAAAARMYAGADGAVIPWTPITDQQISSTSAIRLQSILRAITGNMLMYLPEISAVNRQLFREVVTLQ